MISATEQALSNLVEINEMGRESSIEQKKALSLPQYLKEYCTVKFFSGRQTGQTTAAVNLFNNKNNFFIFPTEEITREHEEKFKIINSINKDSALAMSPFKNYRYYVIDLAFMWGNPEKNLLYLKIAKIPKAISERKKETTIIFIG